jgi:hypothetical protein
MRERADAIKRHEVSVVALKMTKLFYLPLTWFYRDIVEQAFRTADIFPNELPKLMLNVLQLESEIFLATVRKVLDPCCKTRWLHE